MIRSLMLLLLSALCATPAFAADIKKIGTYGKWTAYSFEENGAKSCYIAASPVKAQGDYSKRGDVFAMVTHRPADKSFSVFSYLTGYEYKAQEPVALTIDGESFTLVGAGEVAWTPDSSGDRRLVAAMRKGNKLTVTGLSARGTKTVDTFSLSGTGSALDAIGVACSVTQ